MNKFNIPEPHEVFPNSIYTHPEYHNFSGTVNTTYFSDDFLRFSQPYIQKFLTKPSGFSLDKYNFSVFRSKYNNKSRLIVGEIKFISSALHDILDLSEDTTDYKCRYFEGKPLGKLSTRLYPDAEYTLSLNYEDIPIGFLGFDFISDKEIFIVQIQGSLISNINGNFTASNHFLDGFSRRKVLLNFLEDYLKQNDFYGQIIIQSSINNKHWSGKKGESENQTFNRRKNLEKSYDCLARETGYQDHLPGKLGPNFIKLI